MKLLKKIVPIIGTTATVSGFASTATSCAFFQKQKSNDDWIDGTVQYDPRNFKHYPDQIAVYKEGMFQWMETCQKATKQYIKAIKENPDIIYDDFRSSLNQLDQIFTMVPQYIQVMWAAVLFPRLGLLIADELYHAGLIEEWDIEEAAGIITLVFELFFYYSPIESVNIRTLRGKLADFTIDDERMEEGDDWRSPLVSYKQTMDIDFGFRISFEKWPRILSMIFEKLFGIPPVFDLNIKLTLDGDLHKIPVIVWADAVTRSKKQMFSIISGDPQFYHEYYYGLSLVPNIQDKEYLIDEESDWYAKIVADLEVELAADGFSFKIFGGSKELFTLDYAIWRLLFGGTGRLQVPLALVFALEATLGWSTYYYYDQEYPDIITW